MKVVGPRDAPLIAERLLRNDRQAAQLANPRLNWGMFGVINTRLSCIERGNTRVEKRSFVNRGRSHTDYELGAHGAIGANPSAMRVIPEYYQSAHASKRKKVKIPCTRMRVSGRRYYVSHQGRFLGRDPKGEPGGLHLFSFVRNNPINMWDVLGMLPAATITTGITAPNGQTSKQTMYWRNGAHGPGYYSTPGPSGGWLDPDIHVGSSQTTDDGEYLGSAADSGTDGEDTDLDAACDSLRRGLKALADEFALLANGPRRPLRHP